MEAMSESANPIRLLKIEEELAGPQAAAAMQRYDARLEALDARLGAALAAGLPPAEYGKAEELRAAVEIARKILRLSVKR